MAGVRIPTVDTAYFHNLPITRIRDEPSYFFQPFFVLAFETMESEAVQVKDSDCFTTLENERKNNLAFCFSITGNMTRVFIDIWHQNGLSLKESICTHSMALSWYYIDELTSGFSRKWSEQHAIRDFDYFLRIPWYGEVWWFYIYT